MTEIERDFQDHRKFAEECLEIREKTGKVITYKFGPGPAKMQAAADYQRSRGLPVRLIALKARQVYISTWVASYFTQQCAFERGQKALIVSHEAKSANNIFSYYDQLISSYQPFRGIVSMLPHEILASKIEFEGGGYIDVATANNLKTGRSYSLRHLHLSEYAFYKNAKMLMGGLNQAVPDDAGTSIVIESTANGAAGAYRERWLEANDPTADSAYLAVFLAWWEHPQYSFPVERPAEFQGSLSKSEVDEQRKYNLSLGQLYWRRWAIKNKCDNSVEMFHQEYPANAEEAFLRTGRPRFSHAHLARMPIIADPAIGELECWNNGPRRVLNFLPGEKGSPLVIYKKPMPGRAYVIGCDIAEGIEAGDGTIGSDDPDYTVLSVLDRDTGEQVAKLRGRLWPSAAGEYCALLGEWYTWAYVVPERNGPGIAFIDSLTRAGYPEAMIFHGQSSPDDPMGAERAEFTRLGWNTNQTSRVQLLSHLDQGIRDMSVIIRDAQTLTECQNFVIWPNGKAAAQAGGHDDEVIALALGHIGIRFAPMDTRLNHIRAQQPAATRLQPTVQSYRNTRSSNRDGENKDSRGTLHRF